MKEIPLTQGKVALVDDEDFEKVNQFKWHARRGKKTFYAQTILYSSSGRQYLQMHQLILECSDDSTPDHRDRNGLNNCRNNLRPATFSQQTAHRSRRVTSQTGFIGVSLNARLKKYIAQIQMDGKAQYLGLFKSPIEAAKVRDGVARQLHGEFAVLNFPEVSAAAA